MRMTLSIVIVAIAALFLASCAQAPAVERPVAPTPAAPSAPSTDFPIGQPEQPSAPADVLEDQGLVEAEPANCAEGWMSYQTQVGPKCIQRYDEKLLRSWPQCTRAGQCASTNRTCVYASRTPDGQEIKWSPMPYEGLHPAGFRCVPPEYEDMLLQSSGVTYKDETGQQVSAIA